MRFTTTFSPDAIVILGVSSLETVCGWKVGNSELGHALGQEPWATANPLLGALGAQVRPLSTSWRTVAPMDGLCAEGQNGGAGDGGKALRGRAEDRQRHDDPF